MPSGPCVVCGGTDYPLSYGGPDICPSCDCGATTGSHLSYAKGYAAGKAAGAREQRERDAKICLDMDGNYKLAALIRAADTGGEHG